MTGHKNIKDTIVSTAGRRFLFFLFLIPAIFGLTNCKINSVSQPGTAQPNDTLNIEISLTVSYPDASNPTKGFLGMLVPDDWQMLSGNYTSANGSGQIIESADWTDSVNAHYPPANYGENLKWIGCLSEFGHTAAVAYDVTVNLSVKVGQREGLFNIGYIFTKAATNMLGTSSAAISYPHQIGVPDSSCYPEFNLWKFAVMADYEWEALFNRTSDWTGADGVQSIPLSGNEVYSETNPGYTLFDFGDTFIGEVDGAGNRVNSKMVNNTLALLESNQPDSAKIGFEWGFTANQQPASVFIPNTPNSVSGDWYWPMDGIALGDSVYVFAMLMHSTGTGSWDWEISGVSLLSFVPDTNGIVQSYSEKDVPLIYDETSAIQSVFGAAVFPMTERSGCQNPDGYIYVYGVRSRSNTKDLLAARVPEADFADISKYTYYNGSAWVVDISQSAPLTDQVSQELSVSQLPNGQFILVFQLNTNSETVAIRIGDTPVGPFSLYKAIYTCPEVAEYATQSAFTYNAKAHPHLSKPGELLISYNVNTFGWGSFQIGDIYHPRFIKIKFGEDEILANREENCTSVESFNLEQNFPNPFNATTCIAYRIARQADVVLNIYDLRGYLVRKLVQAQAAPGVYQIIWDGRNAAGQILPSGIYILQMQVKEAAQSVIRESRKMLLLK